LYRRGKILEADFLLFCCLLTWLRFTLPAPSIFPYYLLTKRLKVHKHEIILNFFGPKSNPYMPFVNFRTNFASFPSIFARDGFLDGFWKFRLFIVKICILMWYFWVLFENYSMRMLSIRGNDFIACWTYAEPILSHTEHTRNEFHRMLSILGTDFIACW
jgi:hypothetical protein